MRFKPISYLNLLKVNVFLTKRGIKLRTQIGATPGVVNKEFVKRQTDGAFISSLVSKKYKRVGLGICANGKVWSVLLIKGAKLDDPASATSNALSRTLGLKGQTIIGDEALRRFCAGIDALDLAAEWKKKTNLPFVFAVLSVHKNIKFAKKLEKAFPKKVYVAHSLVCKEAAKRGVSVKDAKNYLNLIEHKIDHKKQIALKRFWRAERLSRYA